VASETDRAARWCGRERAELDGVDAESTAAVPRPTCSSLLGARCSIPQIRPLIGLPRVLRGTLEQPGRAERQGTSQPQLPLQRPPDPLHRVVMGRGAGAEAELDLGMLPEPAGERSAAVEGGRGGWRWPKRRGRRPPSALGAQGSRRWWPRRGSGAEGIPSRRGLLGSPMGARVGGPGAPEYLGRALPRGGGGRAPHRGVPIGAFSDGVPDTDSDGGSWRWAILGPKDQAPSLLGDGLVHPLQHHGLIGITLGHQPSASRRRDALFEPGAAQPLSGAGR
jgi:hypothetical protein